MIGTFANAFLLASLVGMLLALFSGAVMIFDRKGKIKHTLTNLFKDEEINI